MTSAWTPAERHSVCNRFTVLVSIMEVGWRFLSTCSPSEGRHKRQRNTLIRAILFQVRFSNKHYVNDLSLIFSLRSDMKIPYCQLQEQNINQVLCKYIFKFFSSITQLKGIPKYCQEQGNPLTKCITRPYKNPTSERYQIYVRMYTSRYL